MYKSEVEVVSTWLELGEIADGEGATLTIVEGAHDQGICFCVSVGGVDRGYYESLEAVAAFFEGLLAGKSQR